MHILLELYPNGILWSSIKLILKRAFRAVDVQEFEVVPLHSFGKGLSVILASDQDPYFFNYSLHKANMLFDLMKVRKSYKIYDLPERGQLTSGSQKDRKLASSRESDKKNASAVSIDQQAEEKTRRLKTNRGMITWSPLIPPRKVLPIKGRILRILRIISSYCSLSDKQLFSLWLASFAFLIVAHIASIS